MRTSNRLAIAVFTFISLAVSATGMEIGAEATAGCSISHYDIRVEIIPAQKHLSAKAILAVEGLTGDIKAIRFYLHEEFVIHSVRSNGESLKFAVPQVSDKPTYSPSAKAFDIEWPAGGIKAGSRRIEIDYSGAISKTINDVNLISGGLTEITAYCAWFPIFKENQNFTYSLEVTLPEDQRTITDGELISESVGSGTVRRRYERTAPGFDIPLIASHRFKLKGRTVEAVKAEIYYCEMEDSTVESVLDQAIRVTEVLTGKYGDPMNRKKLAVVYSPRSGWGYSRIPLIVGPEEILRTIVKNRKGRTENLHGLSHEIGHFWWNIASPTTSEDWINEGLAEFSSLYAMEQVVGRAEVNKILKSYTAQILGLANAKPILETSRGDSGAYVLFYEKGAYLFEMLRSMLGEENLFSILKSFYQAHQGRRTAASQELVSHIAKAGGEEYRPFLNEFLTTSNLPKIKLTWSHQDGQVEGKVVVRDSTIVNFPLEVLFSTDDRAHSEAAKIFVSSGDNSFRLPVPFRPETVMIDPNGRLLWANPDQLYRKQFIPLVHGPYMDYLPDIIPEENIEMAGKLLVEWQDQSAGSPLLNLGLGWYWFLKKDYRKATGYLERVIPYAEDLEVIGVAAYSALGRCWDLLGDRTTAIRHYEQGERLADELGLSELQRRGYFGDFRQSVFQRGKTIHMAALTGDLELVKELASADPGLCNARDALYGRTPAFFAIMTKIHLHVLEWLISHGADVNVQDPAGRTILSIARSKNDKALTDLLISLGAK